MEEQYRIIRELHTGGKKSPQDIKMIHHALTSTTGNDLKNRIDSTGTKYDLFNLVYTVLPPEIREDILAHIQSEDRGRRVKGRG